MLGHIFYQLLQADLHSGVESNILARERLVREFEGRLHIADSQESRVLGHGLAENFSASAAKRSSTDKDATSNAKERKDDMLLCSSLALKLCRSTLNLSTSCQRTCAKLRKVETAVLMWYVLRTLKLRQL